MFSSEWPVPAEGFQWADRRAFPRGKMDRFLVPIATVNQARYDVSSHKALFRTFAATPPTEAGVLAFANRYGFLGGSCLHKVNEPDPTNPNLFWPGYGELLSDWCREISLMRHAAFDLWENIRNGYAAKLERFIRWERCPGGVRALYIGPEIPGSRRMSLLLANQGDDQPFSELRKGDVLRPAWLALVKIIDRQLERYPLGGFLKDTSNAEKPSAQFAVLTTSLLSAFWLQFARAVANNPEFRQCLECGGDFEITTDKRADARFCSPACRLRAHRKRHKEQAASSTRTSTRRKTK